MYLPARRLRLPVSSVAVCDFLNHKDTKTQSYLTEVCDTSFPPTFSSLSFLKEFAS